MRQKRTIGNCSLIFFVLNWFFWATITYCLTYVIYEKFNIYSIGKRSNKGIKKGSIIKLQLNRYDLLR